MRAFASASTILLIAAVGCREAGTSDLGALRVPDAGTRPADAGPPDDAGPDDAGPEDGGGGPPPDAGPACARPTLAGDCVCETRVGAAGPYFRAECPDPRDVCVPWDTVAGREDPRRRFNRCARPCARDADCPGNQACADVGLPESSGAGRICVDAVAGMDEVCSGTRANPDEVVVPDVILRAPGERRGCAASLTCVLQPGPDFHLDEGVCVATCADDGDCPPQLPYCNPRVLSGATVPPGVCSVARLERGSVCGPARAEQVGLTAQCDTSDRTPPGTACVQVQGLLPERQGFCVTPCQGDAECPSAGGCVFFGGGFGLCADGCTNFPEDCEGPGANGAGRLCMRYLRDGQGNEVGLCMDRAGLPPLVSARFGADLEIVGAGTPCQVGATPSFLRCFEGTTCLIEDFQRNEGQCVFGCDPSAPDADQLCRLQSGLPSVCRAYPPLGRGRGVCTEP